MRRLCATAAAAAATTASPLASSVTTAAPSAPRGARCAPSMLLLEARRPFYGSNAESKFGAMAQERKRQGDRLTSASQRYTVEKIDEAEVSERAANAPPTAISFVGIDLGTTNSCLSYIDPVTKKPRVIPSPLGSWVFPTAVAFDKNHTVRLCGEEARAAARGSASATLCSGKRLIGRGFGELQRVAGQMSKTNNLTMNERGEVTLEVGSKQYTIVHITAMFLRYLKKCAEEFLKQPIDRVVVSVPAFFSPQQKVATEDAALIAGFDVLEVIDEPTAACLCYSVLHPPSDPTKIESNLVFDLGGGTLDCALMDHDVARNTFTLVGTHGDPILGGNDWDNLLVNIIADRFKKKWKIDLDNPIGTHLAASSADHRVLQLEAEKCKIHFSHSDEDYHGFVRGFHFSEAACTLIPLEVDMTKDEYVTLTAPLRERCHAVLERLFTTVQRSPQSVDNVLLVGAMTRDPPVREMLEAYFGRPPSASDACAADYAVAIGAAVRGGMLCGLFPDLNQNTRFVTGTAQARRSGSIVRTLVDRAVSLVKDPGVNPNAIGQRWRGRANGLSTADIEHYAKELVEFEASCGRRLLLDKTETDANNAVQRVARHSTRRHGVTERKTNQLVEQLKFWQYMVHNYHDHEEHLIKVTAELHAHMDDLDGIERPETAASTAAAAAGGTDPRAAVAHASAKRAEAAQKRVAPDGTIRFDLPTDDDSRPSTAEEMERRTAIGVDPMHSADPSAAPRPSITRKVMRREVPVPPSAAMAEIVDKGAPSLAVQNGHDFAMSEATRQEFFENYVDDRAYRDAPAPPGEQGSWQEVKAAIERGDPVGQPVPPTETGEARMMSLEEQRLALEDLFPLQHDALSAEQQQRRAAAAALSSIVIHGPADGCEEGGR